MIVNTIKTRRVEIDSGSIFDLLDESIKQLSEGSVVAVTSKVVAICEGRTIPIENADKEELIQQEADLYLPRRHSKWNFEFTITNRTLVMSAGIDESNADGSFVLWPKDPQKSANEIRAYLKKRFGLKNLGVLITDSTAYPMRWGTLGMPIGYSGFEPKKDYRGTKDLFGRVLKVSSSNIAGGLAAAAVVNMGEGKEKTPIAIIEEVPFVSFQDDDPTEAELNGYFLGHLEDDLFHPFLSSVNWQKGKRKNT